MWSRSTAQYAIITGGCLATVFTQLTASPAMTEFARTLGANEWQIGLLGSLPTGMLFMQFAAALVVNHLRYRRWLWFTLSIAQRLVFLPLAVGPWFWPDASSGWWVWCLIATSAANQGLLHFCTPLWLSWMGDYLPREGLNVFWGRRQLWMQWTASASLFGAAIVMFYGGPDVRLAFSGLVWVATVAGVADILLFLRVEEPAVTPAPQPDVLSVLAAPFRDAQIRSFIRYSCFWNFAAMIGAPFIGLYLLVYIGIDLYHVMLLWAASWIGGAACSRQFGQWIEAFGHRPILILCTLLKTTNMCALLLVPRDPVLVFWIMIPVFMFDAALNAGILLATNGFLLKKTPAANRTMYIAAGLAYAGMVGGLTSIAAGAVLWCTAGWQSAWGSWNFTNFHLLFTLSAAMRMVSVELARRVHEPGSRSTAFVLAQMLGPWPGRTFQWVANSYRGAWGLLPEQPVAEAPDQSSIS